MNTETMLSASQNQVSMEMQSNQNPRGLHVVPAPAKHANTRLTLGNFIADVLIGKTGDVSYCYIVQRVGSAEIIEMGRHESFGEAETAAKEALQRWHLRNQEFPHHEAKAS